MKHRLFFGLILTVILVGSALSAGCIPNLVQSSETFRKTIEVEDGSTLEVYNRNGSVEITSWDNDYVDLVATKRSAFGRSELEQVQIKVQSNGEIIIETEYLQRNARVSVSYEIKVPAGLEVAKVNSSNGSINLKGLSGNVMAETSNGSIDIQNISGIVYAKTSNGKINISATTGVREARTSNGSISVEVPQIVDDIDIRTSNGSVKLYLPMDIHANLNFSTSNGKINTHGLEVATSSFSNTHLRAKIGEGGSTVSITTSNGSIDLYTLN